MKLRVLIADDEPLACDRLRTLLEEEPDVQIVGISSNGLEALDAVRSGCPDVVFLDVHMPDVDGFAFIKALPLASRPLVIVVTADERHALQAFEVDAVDFLLKPFDRERLQKALRRARERKRNPSPSELQEVLGMLRGRCVAGTPLDRISIKENGRIVFVKIDDIDWIVAAGNYADIHTGRSSHLFLSTLNALEARLPSERYIRISRFAIINASGLKEIRVNGHGRSTVILQDGTELVVSRSHRHKLDQLLAGQEAI